MLSDLQIFGALLAALPVGALALALGKALYR
jgi:photosystem I reaction center subunit XII